MHSDEERAEMLRIILRTSRQIAQYDPNCAAGQAAWGYLQFCIRHGYFGFPTDNHRQFQVGNYLKPGRHGSPTTPEEAKKSLGIIVCFSDEAMPCNPMKKITPSGVVITCGGYISPENHILVIDSAELHTPIELALVLLHEARHARHRFGSEFENLPPLDPEEFHESRTWKYELDLLDAYGGEVWQKAVRQELNLVAERYARRQRYPGEAFFAGSGRNYQELDSLFGIPITQATGGDRNMLVAMRANFLLAENAQLPNLDRAYADIVGAYYNWGKKQ